MKANLRLRTLAVAALGAALATNSAQAVQVDITLSPGATACLDSPVVYQEINGVGSVTDPPGDQLTFRLRNVTLGQPAAGPNVGQLISYNLRKNTSPAQFPASGAVFRICANNNVSTQTIKAQLIINGF